MDATGFGMQIEQLKQMIDLGTRAREAIVAAKAAEDAGDMRTAAGHYERFADLQRRVLELSEKSTANGPAELAPVAGTLVNGLFMYADALDALRQTPGADSLRKEACEKAVKYLGDAGAAEAQRSMASSLIMRGRFNEALSVLNAVRDQFRSLGMQLQAARVTMDLADITQWLGDYPRAIELVDEAAELGEAAPFREGLQGMEDIVAKSRLRSERAYYHGIIARYAGKYDEAEVNLREALQLYASMGPALVGVQYQWAVLLAKRGRAAEALEELQKLERHMRGHGMLRPKLAAFLRAKAEALVQLGRTSEALGAITEALDDGTTYFDPDVRWAVQWQHASILRRTGKMDESLRAYRAAAQTIGTLRRAPLGFRLDSAYLRGKLDLFREAISLCVELQRPLEAAWFIEQIKARSLSAVMGNAGSGTVAEGEVLQEFETVTRQIDAIEYRGFAQGWTTEGVDERATLLARRSDLIERLRFSDPRWRNLSVQPETPTEDVLSTVAQRDLAVLTLFLDGDDLTTVLLAKHAQRIHRQRLDSDVLQRLDRYLANLVAIEPEDELNDPATELSLSAEDFVPRELWDLATQYSHVIVVPHRELHLLPWASLTVDGRRLFQQRPVAVLPNLTCVVHLATDFAREPSVALVGPPDYSQFSALEPLSPVEVQALSTLYESRGGVAAGPVWNGNATEAAFLRELTASDRSNSILHTCCHAAADADEPMSSAIYMADAKVDAAEIARARTVFSEVVLSGCSTAYRPASVGDVQLAGDDCLGLPGAFLEAGARNLLVSIPEADDEATEKFMLHYHRARSAGTQPLEAYRQAQVAMLGDERIKPHRWTGMTMYGC